MTLRKLLIKEILRVINESDIKKGDNKEIRIALSNGVEAVFKLSISATKRPALELVKK
jgi:hypothetical protein